MKHSKIIFVLVMLLAISSIDLFAALAEKPVGVPLDGGLLTILGAAGVAFYVTRKRKKSSEKLILIS